MARFSLDREDDDSDDFPDPKRYRTSTSTTTTNRCVTPPPNPNRNLLESLFSDCGEESESNFIVEEVVEEEVEEEEEEEGVESSQSARSAGDGAISVILSDPDVLDCPICLEPLTVPVFQCENGHVACNCCCNNKKLKNTCPSCSGPIGYNRCRAIEKVIESIKISCQNLKHGCKETVPYSRKHDHEHLCLHAPVSCPNIGCTFISSSKKLYRHFSSKHFYCSKLFSYDRVFSVDVARDDYMHEILQEKNEGVIFILNIFREDRGTMVNVNCIGPTTTKRGYSYDLTAKKGETSVVLHSVTENVPNWVEHIPKKAFLVVPREFESFNVIFGALAFFKLEVCIRRPSENPTGI